MGFGPLEIGLIFLIVLLIFGANRIPEIARGMGKGIREFKDATNDIKNEIEREGHRQQGTPTARPPQHGAPQARQQEPAHQESGRPASTEEGPARPSSAANPGSENA